MLSFEEIGWRGGGEKCTSISSVSSVCLGYAPLSKYNQSNNGSVCVWVWVWKSMRWEEGLKMFQLKQTKTNCLVLLLIGIIDYD